VRFWLVYGRVDNTTGVPSSLPLYCAVVLEPVGRLFVVWHCSCFAYLSAVLTGDTADTGQEDNEDEASDFETEFVAAEPDTENEMVGGRAAVSGCLLMRAVLCNKLQLAMGCTYVACCCLCQRRCTDAACFTNAVLL
jgi:hypothetical protein